MNREGHKRDFLKQVYLRHYAFLRRLYPRQSAKAIYHFATLGISGLVSLALLALVAVACLAVSLIVQRPVLPWALPDAVLVAGCVGLAFLPGFAIDAKLRDLVYVNDDVLAFYSSDNQRLRWWLMVLAVLPLGAITAACFAVLRAWSGT